MNIDKFARTIATVAAAAAFCAVCSPTAFGDEAMSLEECREKASAGDAEAMWQLGRRYENGDGVKKDMVKAVAQYRKAADRNHPQACEKMAQLHEKGICVKKDSVLAAKYAARARGESGEIAAARAKQEKEEASVDYIEVALDLLLGRNGKEKDPAAGIRGLYEVAKDNPSAQREFVKRWDKGDLDVALGELDEEEWKLVVPWFRSAWAEGFKKAGQILGNNAYRNKDYSDAVDFWKKSGTAKCWYFVGQFYDPWERGENGDYMKNEFEAKKAYEKCIQIDPRFELARFRLGCLYFKSNKKEIHSFEKAESQFKRLLQIKPNDADYNFIYGLVGFCRIKDMYAKKWEVHKTRYRYRTDQYSGRLICVNLQSMEEEKERLLKSEKFQREPYMECIRKAAFLGSQDAKDFLNKKTNIMEEEY